MKGFITKSWDSYLGDFVSEDRDIYFTERYAKLYEKPGCVAEAFVYRDGEKTYVLPYLRACINTSAGTYFDFETPYGYGGPLVNNRDRVFIEKAFKEFNAAMTENNVIAGFIRFHPLLKNHTLVGDGCVVSFDRKTVAFNLMNSEDELLNHHVHKKHRASIRKAQNLGLRFVADERLSNMNEFVRIYHSAMDDLNSHDFYHFSKEYFDAIATSLSADSFLGLVYLDDKIVSAIVFFLHGVYGHAHLGGGLAEYFDHCPNNLLLFEAALYLKGRGARFLHIGGGTNGSADNSLYKFKKRFSRDEFDFYTGKMILNDSAYRLVCSEWEAKFPEKRKLYGNYLLKYRF